MPRRRRVVKIAGSLAALLCLVAGCASTPATAPAPAPPVVTAPSDVVAGPTTAPPTRGVDVIPDAIRAAPAACGLPVHHLTSNRGGTGRTQTLLQVVDGYQGGADPVTPVTADVTGDGALDLVGVLSCTVDGAPKADNIVVYTGPATPAGAVDLSTAQREKVVRVRRLVVLGGDVRAYWTAYGANGSAAGQYEGTVTWADDRPVLSGVRRSRGPRTVDAGSASFMTVDGNVHCTVQESVAWCDVLQTSWQPPPSPPPTASPSLSPTPSASPGTVSPTQGTGCGDRPYGRTFLLNGGRAKQTCAGEQGPETAVLGGALTAWHRQGWDATVVVNGRRSAALTPGSTMRTPTVICRAGADSVTCTDRRTRANFSAGRTISRVSRQ